MEADPHAVNVLNGHTPAIIKPTYGGVVQRRRGPHRVRVKHKKVQHTAKAKMMLLVN